MSRRFVHLQDTFRKRFHLPRAETIQWFPGHMMKGLLQIQAKLKTIDCIVEVHDARIPFSGRNLRLRDIIKLRPHILLLNKVDLTDLDVQHEKQEHIEKQLKEQGVDTVFFTNLRNIHQNSFLQRKILPAMKELTDSKPRYNREGAGDYNLLVVGIPNVGKSTFINSLRVAQMRKSGKATNVGAVAGVTKSVLSKIKVNHNPSVYIFDTPGIMPPKVPGLEMGMRLAACACLPDRLVGHLNIADYILFWLNSRGHFDYVDYFEIGEPTDNVLTLLSKIAIKKKKILQVKNVATNQFVYRPDNDFAAQLFYSAFREGKLGTFILDDDLKL